VARGFLREHLDTELAALLINSMIFEGVRHVSPAGESKTGSSGGSPPARS
jgi:hypothetical protein